MFKIAKIEIGFETINNLVAQGEILHSISILDGNQSLHIPIEAFDGQPILPALEQLETEWQAILREPVQVPAHRGFLKQFRQQQYNRQQEHIVYLEQVISSLENRRQQVQDIVLDNFTQSRLLNRMEVALGQYCRCLSIAQRKQAITKNHLGKLG